MPTLIVIVRNPVFFESYRNGIFTYKVTVEGVTYIFPVPADDVAGATLPATEKGVFFMRWIRKALASNEFVKIA